MPPPSDDPAFTLTLLPRPFKVVQRDLSVGLDDADLVLLTDDRSRRFMSITRTDEEISIVYECDAHEEGTWRCIKIAGPMDFGTYLLLVLTVALHMRCLGVTGVMCDFTNPLKRAGVPVFAVSTW